MRRTIYTPLAVAQSRSFQVIVVDCFVILSCFFFTKKGTARRRMRYATDLLPSAEVKYKSNEETTLTTLTINRQVQYVQDTYYLKIK
jgi:hypothetical protein